MEDRKPANPDGEGREGERAEVGEVTFEEVEEDEGEVDDFVVAPERCCRFFFSGVVGFSKLGE